MMSKAAHIVASVARACNGRAQVGDVGPIRSGETPAASATRAQVRLAFARASPDTVRMKVIVTGVTGMVGEGVLLHCLESPLVERVLAVSRRSSGRTHPKLTELRVPDFRGLAGFEAQLSGYDACFCCAGVSSVGMKEAEYSRVTYETP